MSDDACPVPTPPADRSRAAMIARMLAGERIAVVGLSDDPSRPSYSVASYLQSVGKVILPVNPNCSRVMGVKCYPSLADVPGPIEVVDVFRRPEHCAAVVREAIEAGAKGVWLQSGIVSDEAARIAEDAGIDFVQDRCLKVDHMMRG